jgi:hypothetical protein
MHGMAGAVLVKMPKRATRTRPSQPVCITNTTAATWHCPSTGVPGANVFEADGGCGKPGWVDAGGARNAHPAILTPWKALAAFSPICLLTWTVFHPASTSTRQETGFRPGIMIRVQRGAWTPTNEPWGERDEVKLSLISAVVTLLLPSSWRRWIWQRPHPPCYC